MNEQQVAAYLHMDSREIHKLASRDKIPCRKIGGQFVFYKGQLDHWVEERMHTLCQDRLQSIEKGVSQHHGYEHDVMLVNNLIPPGGLAVPLRAKTRNSAIRSLVDLADQAGVVYCPDELIEEIRKREELCSTAMVPGAALPHPRHPLPYDIAASFVVVGLTPSGIPFSSQDGSLTRVFFLICCKDERTHLHVLARLARMLHNPKAVDDLAAAECVVELSEILQRLEQQTLTEP